MYQQNSQSRSDHLKCYTKASKIVLTQVVNPIARLRPDFHLYISASCAKDLTNLLIRQLFCRVFRMSSSYNAENVSILHLVINNMCIFVINIYRFYKIQIL